MIIRKGEPVFSVFSTFKCERKRRNSQKEKTTIINPGTVEVGP